MKDIKEKCINIYNKAKDKIKSLDKIDYIIIGSYLIISIILLILLKLKKGIIAIILLTGLYLLGGYIMKKKKGKIKTDTKKKPLGKSILIGVLGFGITCVVAIVIFFGYIVLTTKDFDPNKMANIESTVVYDKDGNEIATLSTQKRERITYDQMPQVLIDALVATEDSRFFQHNGFDFPRFFVATMKQVLGSEGGGASTITMQVSKNNFTSNVSKGFEGIVRKFQDIYLSVFQIEKNYTKQEIIEFYLNDSLLGGNNYGVEQASLYYFGKNAKDLSLTEAALIVGLYKSPNGYNPYKNPEKATDRRKTVLNLMVRHGYITEEEASIANAIPVESLLNGYETNNDYQSYLDVVIDEVIEKTGYDPYIVSMKIYTTMDKSIQDNLNKVSKGETYKWQNDDVQTGVAVTDVNTGGLVGIISGRNQTEARSFNLATMTKRQPGSTAKTLFDYGVGIEYENWSTYQMFNDEEWGYSNGKLVKNWDSKFKGLITAREALATSRNIPALKAFQSLDNSKILEFVTNLGITPEIENGIIHEAHAIGGFNGVSPLQLSAAYGAFANGGYYTKPYTVTKIEYRELNETEEFKSNKKRVMSEETASMITYILRYAVTSGNIGGASINGKTIAAKTGTTNFDAETKKKLGSNAYAMDLWTAAYTPSYSVGLWYGYKTISAEKQIYLKNGDGTHKNNLTRAVLSSIPLTNDQFTIPDGVIKVDVEMYTWPAALVSKYTPSNLITTELFKVGTEPTEESKRFSQLDNVKNIDGTYNEATNQISLTWDYKTPDFIDETFLKNYFSNDLYGNEKDKYYQERISYNAGYIGTVQFNIYLKNADGTLTYVDKTTDHKYTYKISGTNTSSKITLVVKAGYTIFKQNESSGTEYTTTVKTNSHVVLPDTMTVTLKGSSTVNIKVGSTYTDQTPAYTVTDNGEDVTEGSVVSITVRTGAITKNVNQENSLTSLIKTDSAKTYTITYTITYNKITTTKTRTVNVSN